MKSHEDYKEQYPESSKGELCIPRSSDGKPNIEIIEISKILEKNLAEYPFFVGVAPYGSRMKGYSVDSSDIDIAIFYDSSKIQQDELDENFNDFKRNAEQLIIPSSGIDTDKEINISYQDLSSQSIKKFLITGRREEYLASIALGDFCGIASGPQVETYRASIGYELKKLPEEKRKQAIDAIVKMLMAREKMKMESSVGERIPEVKGQEQEILDARKMLWQKRVEKVFGISNS